MRSRHADKKGLAAFIYPDRAGRRYDVRFNGELVVHRSRMPELDLARALRAREIIGVVTIYDGATGMPRVFVDIERAALLTVEEGPNGARFVKWRKTCVERSPTVETRTVYTEHAKTVSAAGRGNKYD